MKKILTLTAGLMSVVLLGGCALNDAINEVLQDDVELVCTVDEGKARLFELGATEGFLITYEYAADEEQGEATIGNKGDVFWLVSDELTCAVKKEGDVYKYYEKSEGQDAFAYSDEIDLSQYNQYIDAAVSWLFYAHSQTAYLKEKGTATIAGRQGKEYSFRYANASQYAGDQYDIDIVVDNALGITLKADVTAKGSDHSDDAHIEIKSFVTGDAVVAPALA